MPDRCNPLPLTDSPRKQIGSNGANAEEDITVGKSSSRAIVIIEDQPYLLRVCRRLALKHITERREGDLEILERASFDGAGMGDQRHSRH